MRTSPRFASLLLVAGAAAACNTTSTGHSGKLTFTPSDCGAPLVCSFSDRLAVGGAVDVDLAGVKASINTSGLHLVSSAPWILEVDNTSSSHAQLLGISDGTAQLLAVNDSGATVDSIDVEVAQIDDVEVDVYGDAVQGPDSVVDADAGYRIAAGFKVSVRVSPRATGLSVMGDVQYDVRLTEGLAFATSSDSDVARGKIDFVAPPGEEDLYVAAPGGAWKKIAFRIE